ncbi:LIC_11051 family fibronectin-binding protein [Leptospira borgpetersenii]|uniref:LIC_11051 family fibronectin-binding protein n=1 Tax=Leptospira borgpetersenii TaxID=174 RepID=UPI0007736885|nr:leucine-rich repeat domain-containing protein [Leptospira borgpetersenii]MBE8399412.1 WGR domain-containing protein [Leptospira borgpetersenii serovar Tarassovi]MBE8402423.1 WGR domain-containing protein [Leptospira borgpetersenii serovar Tarassovi]MBE8407076.1 WGR domain-containing protein [Leptospira borgpetersenii serovar Tarassovi]MBE8412467.1 WGR domain-containing protein [Leptospira borgpetersenii serovar Tarassovi]MBE8414899.1 WGR domain-containing protein [Leptospira borgpetersenii 
MKHHLTYKDGKSDKFWNIEVSGTSFIVTYGKTGTDGQTQTKTFGSKGECQKEVQKLLSEKLKKGYMEGEERASSAPVAKKNAPQKKSEIKKPDSLLSETFHKFLKVRVGDFESSTYSKLLQKMNWETLAGEVFDAVYLYWEELGKSEKSPVGIFDIRWDDANTDHCIEFDYDLESNDPESALVDGSIRNIPILDFSNFIKDHLKQKPVKIREVWGDEDFSIVKDILCRLAQEVIRKTTETEVFIRIPKQQPYFLMFSYYHDEDAFVFFDSTTKEQKDLYPTLKLGKSPLFKYYSKGSESISVLEAEEIDLSDIGLFENLKEFSLSNCKKITSLKSLCELKNIRTISIEEVQLTEFPDFLLGISSLRSLYFTDNGPFTENKTNLPDFSNVEKLCLNNNALGEIPEFVYRLSKLKELIVIDNQLIEFPERLADLKNLEKIDLARNVITGISNLTRAFVQVKELGLYENRLASLEGIRNFPNLERLLVWQNELETIPVEIVDLKKLIRIDLSKNRISNLPDLNAELESVKELSLGENRISKLPKSLVQFPNLESLGLAGNQLEELSDLFGNFKKLEGLYLSNNGLVSLPMSIAQLKSLEDLSLKNNKFAEIPEILKELKKLKELWMNDNRISELPEFLSEMKALRELKIGNNPVVQNQKEVKNKMAQINSRITLYFS